MRFDGVDILDMTDEQVEEAAATALTRIQVIRDQVTEAKRKAASQHVFADPDWLNRAEHSLRLAGRQHQALLKEGAKRRAEVRRQRNENNRRLRIAISGHGRSGKDTAAELLARYSSLRYVAGTSKFAADVVFERWGKAFYLDAEACWQDRHNHRMKWTEIMGEFNRNDPVAVYRRCLEHQDILTGVRWKDEQAAVRASGLVDLWIWIERDVPRDPTQQYGADACDIVILNNGSILDLGDKLIALAKTWGVFRG